MNIWKYTIIELKYAVALTRLEHDIVTLDTGSPRAELGQSFPLEHHESQSDSQGTCIKQSTKPGEFVILQFSQETVWILSFCLFSPSVRSDRILPALGSISSSLLRSIPLALYYQGSNGWASFHNFGGSSYAIMWFYSYKFPPWKQYNFRSAFESSTSNRGEATYGFGSRLIRHLK